PIPSIITIAGTYYSATQYNSRTSFGGLSPEYLSKINHFIFEK
ncbi:unnamed protein product, partial [Rotaria sordida]